MQRMQSRLQHHSRIEKSHDYGECPSGECIKLYKRHFQEHELSSADNKTQNDKLKNAKEVNKESKKQYLSIIKNQQKASRKVKCSIKGCELRFALDEYRIRHEKCHVNSQKKQFKCPACEKMFSVWRICSLHMWKCHEIDVGLLSCVICSYKTLSPCKFHNLINSRIFTQFFCYVLVKLWPHLLTHEDKRQYLCNECGKSFKQFTQLRNHQVFHLANTEDVSMFVDSNYVLLNLYLQAPNWICQQRCNICGNIFSDTKSLKKHIQSVHNKFKPYVCNICGHKTARKAMLEVRNCILLN